MTQFEASGETISRQKIGSTALCSCWARVARIPLLGTYRGKKGGQSPPLREEAGEKEEETKERKGEFTGERGRNVVKPASSKRAHASAETRLDSRVEACKYKEQRSAAPCPLAITLLVTLFLGVSFSTLFQNRRYFSIHVSETYCPLSLKLLPKKNFFFFFI